MVDRVLDLSEQLEMQTVINTTLPPSGHDHAVSLILAPECHLAWTGIVRQLVLARTNFIQIFDVWANGRLVHRKSHLCHGVITGMARIKTLDSAQDGLHRLLVSFKSAKLSLLEWNADLADLIPISLHSYERLPSIRLTDANSTASHLPLLRSDPVSRAAALLLSTNTEPTLALLPLFQDALDLTSTASLPYAPSFVLPLRSTLTTTRPIFHVQDFQFLPGFNEPTIALLYTATPTWAGRLEQAQSKDSYGLIILTLDFSGAGNHAVILDLPSGLPYNAFRLIAAPKDLGGVVVLSGDILTHIDQSGKMLHLALTGWANRVSSVPVQYASSTLKAFDNCQLLFSSSLSALLFAPTGDVYPLTFQRDGRTLTSIQIDASPVGRTSSPSTVEFIGRDLIYVASALSAGVLMRYNQPIQQGAVSMDVDEQDEDDLYDVGPKTPRTPATERPADLPLLELCDSIDAYGPIRAMTVGLVAADVDPELVACTGGLHSGGLTIFHRGITPRRKQRVDENAVADENADSSSPNPITLRRSAPVSWSVYRDRHAKIVFRAAKDPNGIASGGMVIDDTLYEAAGPAKDFGLAQFRGFADRSKEFAVAASADGQLEIFTLPDQQVVFTNQSLCYLPSVLSHSDQKLEPGPPEEDSEVSQILLADFGQSDFRPHLTVLLKNNLIAVYELVLDFTALSPSSLACRFVKVLTHELPSRSSTSVKLLDVASGPSNTKGVFVTGDKPFWILKSDHGAAQIYAFNEKSVSYLQASEGRISYVSSGVAFQADVGDVCCDQSLPWATVNSDRTYMGIAFDKSAQAYVAASVYNPPFEIFGDEDGTPLWRADHPSVAEPQPHNMRSALELIVPGSWESIHGYEFRSNEVVSSIQSVTLESKSTPQGLRDFIGIGTTISRSEDYAVRGCLYLFEVVQIIPPDGRPDYSRQLKLRFKEDQKASVAHITDINGYFVHSLGLKLFIKALDLDERLLSVGFLDIGAHTTSIRTLKNFILLGDALRGITFIAFQESPYKIIALGKDIRARPTVTADFIVYDGKLAFLTTDKAGVARTLEYNPTSLETRGGERLISRTEFQTAAEVTTSLLYSKKVGSEEEAKQSGLVQACVDGSLFTVSPTREAVYKRLQLLERQLQRHAPHFASLNPRAFRNVENQYVSRSLNRGTLDGNLLDLYAQLHGARQAEMASNANSNVETVRFNIKQLKGPW